MSRPSLPLSLFFFCFVFAAAWQALALDRRSSRALRGDRVQIHRPCVFHKGLVRAGGLCVEHPLAV